MAACQLLGGMSSLLRSLLVSVVSPLAFVASCGALVLPAMRLADPLTHEPLDVPPAGPFPVLVVDRNEPRIVMLDAPHATPSLPSGATFLIPEGLVRQFEEFLWKVDPATPERDSSWALDVEQLEPGKQRIELYLMGDGYRGTVYDATARSVKLLHWKIAGPGFAFVIALVLALPLNVALWLGALLFVRRHRATIRGA